MKKRILIVDDDIAIREALKTFLQTQGYDVTVGTNGWEGLNLVSKVHPDLLLLDINMPGLDGFNTLDVLRMIEKKELRVIFVSALGDRKSVLKGMGLAADDFVRKPFNLKDLASRIEQQLMDLDFNALREIVANLKPLDRGLEKELTNYLSDKCNPYLATYKGLVLCVLVNKKSGAKSPQQLTYEQAFSQLVIVARYPSGWRILWPKGRAALEKPEKKAG